MKPREQIFVEWLNGQNITSLGQQYKLSRLRIQQIVRKVARGLYVQRGQELAAEREACAVAICSTCQLAQQTTSVRVAWYEPDEGWSHRVWDPAVSAYFWVPCEAAAIRARGGE